MKFLIRMVVILTMFATVACGGDDDGDGASASTNTNANAITASWLTGDFHEHSYFTDGSNELEKVITAGVDNYSLDFIANSEHGGGFNRDGYGNYWDDNSSYYLKGDNSTNGGHRVMWRWQSLQEYVYPWLVQLRNRFSGKTILTGVEWNAPSHEHADVMIEDNNSTSYVSVFDYYFDANDTDKSDPFNKNLFTGNVSTAILPTAKMTENTHQKAIEGAKWLEKNFKDRSWIIPTHPERRQQWHVYDFRDLNNAAPDVVFGFDGMPGHQKAHDRGEFTSSAFGGGTYGGAGYFIAKVGGLWDALLGEGRHWWTFVNSDFHATENDFWPGEYSKTYVYVKDLNGNNKYDVYEIVKGLQSGNSFAVHGDLINALQFTLKAGSNTATMGQDINTSNKDVEITIAFISPDKNNHGDKPILDHIDLIAGDITGKIDPSNPDYTKDTNPTTRVLARFNRDNFTVTPDGWYKVTFKTTMSKSTYFRLRGTNLAPNTPEETDADGNPLPDSAKTTLDGEAEAWADLWFYSNPIFVYLK
jgi:hypothetical protein